MIESITRIQQQVGSELERATDLESLERLRIHYLGKKGVITGLMHQLKDVDGEKRKELGASLNQLKSEFEAKLGVRQKEMARLKLENELTHAPALDVTLPGQFPLPTGSLHPISTVMDEMIQAMKRVGYSVASGPEIETEFYNFEALNTPANHPARDLQDTFYVDTGALLRSHTSPVQIRAMKAQNPPLQIIAIGRVYRSDYDLTHTPMFHQMEGLVVNDGVSLADLKGTIHYLVEELFGTQPIRFRPSFFPFTEPSAEIDMRCIRCRGEQTECRLCGSSGWLEIGGCGMVHPNVFRHVGYDPERVFGFAFGMGIERISMIKYGIDDIRSFFENDYRLLEQF